MDEIAWERTADGIPARLKHSDTDHRLQVLALLNLSIAKLTDVSIISADFRGATAVFEPQVSVYLAMDTYEEWMGVYQLGFPHEEDEAQAERDVFPVLCLRRAVWHKKQDVRQLREARRKRAYVEGEGPINSRIVFITAEMYPEISHLIEDIQRIVRRGIPFTAAVREEPQWHMLQLDLNSEIHFSLSYVLSIERSEDIETWAAKWQSSFAHVDYTGGIVPDHGCFMSYRSSIEQRLEQFSDK